MKKDSILRVAMGDDSFRLSTVSENCFNFIFHANSQVVELLLRKMLSCFLVRKKR